MKKRILTITLIIIAIVSVCCFMFSSKVTVEPTSKTAYEPQRNLNAPIEIPSEEIISLKEAENINKPQVLLFYVDWCGYCRRFMPIFGEFANKYKDSYSFVAINCDNPENKAIVKKFHIMGFPSLFISDEKIGHTFPLHMASTVNKEILTEELDNYLKVKQNMLNTKK